MEDDVTTPEGAVRAFLSCGTERDWSRAEELLTADITRIGPDGDVKSGRVDYLAFVRQALEEASYYSYEVRRMAVSQDGRVVLVEIDETLVEQSGDTVEVSEAMVFDLTADLRISRLSVYARTDPAKAD